MTPRPGRLRHTHEVAETEASSSQAEVLDEDDSTTRRLEQGSVGPLFETDRPSEDKGDTQRAD